MARLQARTGSLRQLEILLAVAECGGVSAAAEQLHLSQPTVSMQLRKLSDAVGHTLYEQVGRQLRFTEAGEAVLAAAADVMRRFEQLDMALADLRGLKSGTLRLAVVTTSKYFVPHLLGPFCERYPGVDVELHVGNRESIIARASRAQDDFYVFSHPPENLPLTVTEFLSNPLVAIAPEGHPLAGRKQIPLAELCAQPFLMREQGSGTRYALEKHLAEKGMRLNVRMTIESNEAIKHAVMSGLGVSVLSSHTLRFGGDAGLVQLDVAGLPVHAQWYLMWPAQKRLSPLADAFLKFLHEGGRDLLEGAG